MTLRDTVLKEALTIFKKEGLTGMTEGSMMQRLDISQATFREIFSDLKQMVNEVVAYSAEEQKREHRELLKDATNAVEEIMLLLQHGIQEVRESNPLLYKQLQEDYPAAWEITLNHFASYSYPQLNEILNKGVLEGHFRRDVNAHLVTKILIEQVNMMLNPVVFPPERYNLAEVFRSIFLYYLRGICTETGRKVAEEFFTRHAM